MFGFYRRLARAKTVLTYLCDSSFVFNDLHYYGSMFSQYVFLECSTLCFYVIVNLIGCVPSYVLS